MPTITSQRHVWRLPINCAITATFTCALPAPLAWLIDTSPAAPLKEDPARRLDADRPGAARPTTWDDTTPAASVDKAARFAWALPPPRHLIDGDASGRVGSGIPINHGRQRCPLGPCRAGRHDAHRHHNVGQR